jgi:hypothetical protein
MYEMSQRHPVWVAENHVNPCNSVLLPRIHYFSHGYAEPYAFPHESLCHMTYQYDWQFLIVLFIL